MIVASIMQMLSTTVSLISICIMGVAGQFDGVTDYNGTFVFTVSPNQSGFALGGLVVSSKPRVKHEYGHILQEQRMGPFYLPLIALPSIIGVFLYQADIIDINQYQKIPGEAWANYLGGYP